MPKESYTSDATVVSTDVVLYENTYHNFSCPKHFHETYQVEVISRGEKNCFCKGRQHNSITKGMLVLVNPGEIHTGGNSTSSALLCRAFYPSLSDWNKVIGESFEGQNLSDSCLQFTSPVVWDEKLCRNIEYLFSLSRCEENYFLIKELYHKVMLDLLTHYLSSDLSLNENFQNYTGAVNRAKEYINDHISDKLLLEDIARAAYVSPFHFLRIFKNFMGITLHQYVLSLRIERAKNFLQQKDRIDTTFRRVGFSDQTHFTKVFKKMTGLTPGRYSELIK